MTNEDMAEEIAQTVRDLRENLKAWMTVATQGRSEQEKSRLGRLVLDDVTRVRSGEDYRKHVAQFRQALDRASDDARVLQALYDEIQRKIQIPLE